MADPLPSAGFSDPLLKQRSQRRMAYFKANLVKPLAFAGLFGSLALAAIEVLLVPAGWLVVVIAALYFADQRAKAEWWLSLLSYLKLRPLDASEVEPATPLLRSGDEREVLRAGVDDRRALLIFRSTDVGHDSKGNRTETHHNYTVVMLRQSTPVIRFLSAHEHRFAPMKFLGSDLRGKTLRDVEGFKVESVELDERFSLRSSTEDGTRARQIFKPSFIVWFTRNGLPFEYEDGNLIVFVDRVLEHAEEFKLLLSRADAIEAAITGRAEAP